MLSHRCLAGKSRWRQQLPAVVRMALTLRGESLRTPGVWMLVLEDFLSLGLRQTPLNRFLSSFNLQSLPKALMATDKASKALKTTICNTVAIHSPCPHSSPSHKCCPGCLQDSLGMTVRHNSHACLPSTESLVNMAMALASWMAITSLSVTPSLFSRHTCESVTLRDNTLIAYH